MDEKARDEALKTFREVHRGQYVDGNGELIGPEPQYDTYGIYWICLDNPFKTLAKIAKMHRAAVESSELGNRQDLIDFYHDQLFRTAPKTEDGENMDRLRLAQRSAASTYARSSLPQETVFLTAAVDQQKRVLAWKIKAHDMEGRTWRVDWGFENICGARDEPTPNQRIEAFDRLAPKLEAGIRATNGMLMKPVLIGVDIADWPAEVAPWMRNRPGWLALRGSGSHMAGLMQKGNSKTKASLPGWYELRTQNAHGGEWDVLWLDSDQIKHEVVHSFSRPINTSGASMLPLGLAADSQYLRELTSEEWRVNPDTHKYGWVQIYKFNEAWDLDYYTHALGQYWRTEHPAYQAVQPAPSIGRRDHARKDEGWTAAMGDWS
jgi:phage terminase large subunit GpA-like protein